MIIDAIITTLLTMVKLVLSILPQLPATPAAVENGAQWVLDTIGGAMSVLTMLYTPPILTAVILIALAIFNFEWLYHSVMWVLKKIPMLNIK